MSNDKFLFILLIFLLNYSFCENAPLEIENDELLDTKRLESEMVEKLSDDMNEKSLDLIENKEELLKEIEEYEDQKRLSPEELIEDLEEFVDEDEEGTTVAAGSRSVNDDSDARVKSESHLTTVTVPVVVVGGFMIFASLTLGSGVGAGI